MLIKTIDVESGVQVSTLATSPSASDPVVSRKIIALLHKYRFLYVLLGILIAGALFAISLGCVLLPSPLLILAGFFAILLAGALLFRPHLALLTVGLCACLPSFTLALPGHNMHLVEPVVLLLPFVALLHRCRLRPGLPHILAALFLGWMLLSFIHVPALSNAQSPYGADKRLLMLLIIFMAFFCATWLAPKFSRPDSFLCLLLLMNLPLYLIGLAQALGLSLTPPLVTALDLHTRTLYNAQQSVQGRLWGPFPWPVNFGMYLVNLFAISLACWFLGTNRWHRRLGCAMTMATTLLILGSGTRSALIALAILLPVACLLARRFGLLCLILITLILTGALFSQQLIPLLLHDSNSADNRLLIWSEALRLIQLHPWLGIGLQQFPLYYKQLIVSSSASLEPLGIHPHEQYLEWAVESGLLWLVIGAGLLISILVTCWRAFGRVPARCKSVQLAALLAILANIVIGFFDTPLDQLEGGTLLFMLAGLALGQAYYHKQSRNEQKNLNNNPTENPDSIRNTAIQTPQSTHIAPTTLTEKDTTQPDTHRTSSTIILQLLSWGVALPLILPVTALLTRYLGPEQYGAYSLTFPFLTFFALLSGTALDPLLIRQLSLTPRSQWRHILSYAAGSRAISTLLSVGAALALSFWLPISSQQRDLFWLGSVSLFFSFSFNGLRFLYTLGFRAEQRIGPLVLLETTNRLITAVLIALVVWQHWPLLPAYALLVYSDLPLFLLQVWLASRRYTIKLRFNLARFCEHMLLSLPLLGHQALSLLGGLVDQCVLLLIAGPGPVGLYALASRAVDPLISIVFAYANGLYPLLCTTFAQGPAPFARLYQHALRLLALAVLPLAVCITTQAHLIVSLLGGPHFQAAAPAVQFLIWAMALTFFNQVAERACTAAHQERRIPLITASATGFNLVLNIILIPPLQITGAGIASVFSEGLTFVFFLWLLKPSIHLRAVISMLCLILACNLPALALLLWQPLLSPFLTLPVVLLLTSALYFITRQLTILDLRHAQHFLLRKKVSRPRVGIKANIHSADTSLHATLIIPCIHP